METLGATLTRVQPGAVEIQLPIRAALTQQHGFIHAGAVATIGDSACGYAALSLMPVDTAVLTIEYKINLMAPAQGDALIARGRVVRSGRTITVCEADIVAVTSGHEVAVALLVATVMAVRDRPGLHD
jgi:uncharacterized protein (TIGR00369 family)